MKTIILFIGVILFFTNCGDNKEYLFNGKNLEGWYVFVADSSVNPEEYFYVNDGMIETIGKPVGYLCSEKEYENYKLHVEWRYPVKAGNSGILLHITGEDKIWPNHYQGQLKYKCAGDFIVHGEGLSATVRDTVYTSGIKKPLLPKDGPDNENEAGEWNSYDIICQGNTIELKVNGETQNVATNCSHTKGKIGLQVEGRKIQFKNLYIEKLK